MPSKYAPTRQRKHKVIARQTNGPERGENNSDATVILSTKSEREVRRQKLRDELRVTQPKVSAKKQKRLDKYIDNKLKKDENQDLLKKLAEEKKRFDPTGLQSSKNFNPKKRSFQDYAHGQTDLGQDTLVVNHNAPHAKRQSPVTVGDHDTDSLDSFEEEHTEAFGSQGDASDQAWISHKASVNQGHGLAQPLNIGHDGLPIIPARNAMRKKKPAETSIDEHSDQDTDENASWNGFDDIEGIESDSQSDDEMSVELSTGEKLSSRMLDQLLDTLEDGSDVGESDDELSDDTSVSEAGSEEDLMHEIMNKKPRMNAFDGPGKRVVQTDGEDEEDASSVTSSPGAESTDSSAESSSNTSSASAEQQKLKPRQSAFKSWATQQLNVSLGHTPFYEQTSTEVDQTVPEHVAIRPAAGYRLGVPALTNSNEVHRAYSRQVVRTDTIQKSRQQLPIIQKEQEIMEAISANPVIMIKGDTGSGKTTQLPQFLFEAGYGDRAGPNPGLIGITQPRRVAAVSMAKRVSEELGDCGAQVAHQIRFDSTVSDKTSVKFMTDGILLRELSQDLLLNKYSAIVIDEAHERSVNTDILIGMLSKIVPARMKKSEQNPDPKPLKLIIMSATLDINDFLHDKLFSASMKPPVVVAEGRQHKVTTHFALQSRSDYLEETIEKVKRAHRKLPPGGILVFLTGQQEIKFVQSQLRADLRQSSTSSTNENQPKLQVSAIDTPLELDDMDIGTSKQLMASADTQNDDVDILVDEDEADQEFVISDDEDIDTTFMPIPQGGTKIDSRDPYDNVHILPLYSQLPTNQQLRVFEPPPARSRLIILATNVAETSLTIPNIRYVFDCGRSKEKKFDPVTGVQSFEIDYISKASAAQRAGRAGRTGPGHCWRLYSSAVYERYFPEHTTPEILRTPAENVVLSLKGFRYPRPVVDFPFPSRPASQALNKAEVLLKNLGALNEKGQATDIGRQLSMYPLNPRHGRIVINASKDTAILPEIIALVAAITVDDIFVQQTQLSDDAEDDAGTQQSDFNHAHATFSRHSKTSDALKMLTATQLYLDAPDKQDFCSTHFLRPKAMSEIAQLNQQLRALVNSNSPGLIPSGPPALKTKLNHKQVASIQNIIASGYPDQLAIRYDLHPTPSILERQPRRAIDVPYLPLIPLPQNSQTPYVFIHPTSILSRASAKSLPAYISYKYLQTSQPSTINTTAVPKTRLFPLTALDATAVFEVLKDTDLMRYGKPVPKTKIEEVSGKERIAWVSVEVGPGQAAWQLPPVRVRQVLDVKSASGWKVIEALS